MTMNDVYSKLRLKNIKNYYMLIFCTILSVVLVTSYAVMYLSPTVQTVLPVKGDSRKMVDLIFGIAIVGCVLLTTYASSLFFKYKSKETGVLLSLGAKKSQIKRVLFRELLFIIAISSLVGIILSIPISFGIWKVFQLFIIDTKEMIYKVGWSGIVHGVYFCLFVTICIFIMASKFIKKTNIIDILNEHRKCELVKEVKVWYGIVGGILVVLGLVLGYVVPMLSITVLHYALPEIWSVTYLFSFIGIYMITVYVVVHNKKGRNLKRYYKNIVPNSMMQFIGKQTVKSMCIISFLIIGALWAVFYVPTVMSGLIYSINNNPIDYSFYYKMTENQIKKEEIYALSKKYNVNITSYSETPAVLLIVNGVEEHWADNGKITYKNIDKICYAGFFSESGFNKVSGKNVHIKSGEYLTIEGLESNNTKSQSLNKVTNPVTNVSEKMKYAGIVSFECFVNKYEKRYVISDEDYKKQSKSLSKENFENFVLFNVENPNKTYDFANELKNQIIKRSSKDAAVSKFHDDYAKKLSVEKGEKYYADDYKVDLAVDNNMLFLDWKYYPNFKILSRQDFMKNSAVFLMLFIYIAVVCFTAVAIISYTRSITIAINNQTLFDDLKKLGAKNKYIERCVKIQLKKIFLIPTIVGSFAVYLFYIIVLYGNSKSISTSEYMALGINLGIIFIASLFMYIIYKISFKKFKKIIGI